MLDRMGLKIAENPDGTAHIWQPPGDDNALGRIRFNFPNKFLVYQHDTPDKYLFAYAKRAFSHGCMRVQDPLHYAEVLLSLVRPGDGYTEERIKKMYGPSEINIDFPTPLQVDLTYQTAFVDDAGKLEFRDDVYGRDKALLAILKGDRKDADIPIEHKEDTINRELLAMPEQPSLFGGGRGIFGGGAELLSERRHATRPAPALPAAAISSRGCSAALQRPGAAAEAAAPGRFAAQESDPVGGYRRALEARVAAPTPAAVNGFFPASADLAARGARLRPYFATLGR